MRLDIGSVVGQSFKILFANLLAFMTLCGLIMSPTLLANLYIVQTGATAEEHPLLSFLLVFSPLLSFVATGAITYGVFQHLRGKRADFGDCLRMGLGRLFPIIGVSILTALVVFGGFLLLIIPGFIAYAMLYVAVPTAVVERPGVLASLRRSRELTAGNRWPVFGVMFVIGILSMGIALIATMATGEFGLFAMVVQWVLEVFATALAACSMTLVYYQLRSMKERVDIEDIAAVFA